MEYCKQIIYTQGTISSLGDRKSDPETRISKFCQIILYISTSIYLHSSHSDIYLFFMCSISKIRPVAYDIVILKTSLRGRLCIQTLVHGDFIISGFPYEFQI